MKRRRFSRIFSAESWSKPARLSEPAGKELTPPPRVEKALANPSRSNGPHAIARTPSAPSSQRKPARSISVSAVIVSIGIDIIEIRRVREVLARTPRFRERVFTEAERAYCDSRGANFVQHYAARFAAKEAAFKALRTGWRDGLAWHHVEVLSDDLGAPLLQLSGHARELFEGLGRTHAQLSLAHTVEHPIAQVIFERR